MRKLAPVATMFLCVLIGCAIRHPSPQDVYRLTEIDSQVFLIAPAVTATHRKNQTIRLAVETTPAVQQQLNKKDCSVRGQWFSIRLQTSGNTLYWVAETPSAETWQKSDGDIDLKGKWKTFLDQLAGLQQTGCFASAKEYLSIRNRLAESLSLPADDVLYYRYAYGPGGYVDLSDGMELRIERNITHGNQNDLSNPLDTIVTSYAVARDSNSEIQLKPIRGRDSSKEVLAGNTPYPDARLATQLIGVDHIRLFLQGLVISGNIKNLAILLGSSSPHGMQTATEIILNNPRATCDNLTGLPVTCVAFHGLVTVSPMIHITVNGHSRYVPIGVKVSYVLPLSHTSHRTTTVSSLRVRRLYDGRYVQVEFAPDQQDLGELLLCQGDKVSWHSAGTSG